MKVFIVLSAFVACACATGLEGYAAPAIVSKQMHVNTGESTQSRKQDASGNYAFAYDAAWQDGAWGSGAHSQRESGDAWGNKEGAYSLNIGDGRSRVVKYVADGAGFRASIKTNEPGIVASNPAAADINTPHGAPIAHAPAVVATQVGGYSDGGLAMGGYGGDLLGGKGLAMNGYGGGYGMNGGGYGGALLAGNGLAMNGYGGGYGMNGGGYGAGLALNGGGYGAY